MPLSPETFHNRDKNNFVRVPNLSQNVLKPSSNPYQSPAISNESLRFQNTWSIYPRNVMLFALAFIVIGLLSLLGPMVLLYDGRLFWGRAPIWYAFVATLAPEYEGQASTQICIHIAFSFACASVADRFASSWAQSR